MHADQVEGDDVIGEIDHGLLVEQRRIEGAAQRRQLAWRRADVGRLLPEPEASFLLGLLIGRNAARNLKMNLGLTDAGTGWVETVGVDVASRNPRVEHVTGRLVAGALEHIVAMVVSSVREMLSDIPPNLAEDVVRGKIRLAGGGALLPGLASRIEVATGIPVLVVDDPLRCVLRGAAEILDHGRGPSAAGMS